MGNESRAEPSYRRTPIYPRNHWMEEKLALCGRGRPYPYARTMAGKQPGDNIESRKEEETTMSSRIFQSIVLQMKECTDRVIGVIDDQGTVVSCNHLAWIGEKWEGAEIGRAHV